MSPTPVVTHFSFGFIVVAFIALVVLFFFIRMFIGLLKRPRIAHETLTCPHCEAETRAALPVCQNCQQEI